MAIAVAVASRLGECIGTSIFTPPRSMRRRLPSQAPGVPGRGQSFGCPLEECHQRRLTKPLASLRDGPGRRHGPFLPPCAHELEASGQPPHYFFIAIPEHGHRYDKIDDNMRGSKRDRFSLRPFSASIWSIASLETSRVSTPISIRSVSRLPAAMWVSTEPKIADRRSREKHSVHIPLNPQNSGVSLYGNVGVNPSAR